MIDYIPILTSLFTIYFASLLWKHYRTKPDATYLLWWLIGVITYGAGTITESVNTLAGWSEPNFRAWYIFGALLGGFPLAQGTVYLLLKRKTAHILTALLVTLILLASVCVVLSPLEVVPSSARLSGAVFKWQWVRSFSPIINSYSFLFLFGGAVYSAIRYFKVSVGRQRFSGNIYIAIGALLPGIGGFYTRLGYVEVLYVTELIGIILIFVGYRLIKKTSLPSIHKRQSQLSPG